MDALLILIWGMLAIASILIIIWFLFIHKGWNKPAEIIENIIHSVFGAIPP